MAEIENKTVSVIESFDNTFEKGNLIDTLSQAGEFGLDLVLEAGEAAPILKDIPVLGLIVSGTKTVANVRSYVLAKKVYNFFYCVKYISQEKRQRFAEEYFQENREDIATALLSILDRLNNKNYVPIICNLMRSQMNGLITIPEFNRAVLALERTAYTDLQGIHKFQDNYYEDGLAEALESAGLVYQSVIDGGDATAMSDSGVKMRLTPTGRILLVYGLGYSAAARTPRTTDVKSELSWGYIDEDGTWDLSGEKQGPLE